MSSASNSSNWQFSIKIMLPVILAVVVTVMTVAGFVAWSIGRTDSHAIARQAALFERALEERVAEVPSGQADLAVWDDALQAVALRDTDWLHENVGASAFDYYGHNRVYIVDAEGKPVYAMREGGQVNAKAYDTVRDTLSPLVDQLGTIDSQAATDAYNTGLGDAPPAAVDLIMIEGQPAIVSAMPLLSHSGDMIAPAGQEPIMIAATILDDDIAAELTRQYLFEHARFLPADAATGGEGLLPVHNGAGEVIAWFAWEPDRPGARILNDTFPALLAALGVAGVIIALLLRNLHRASAQLQAERAEAHHRALHDPLTGLGNRALFRDRLEQALASMPRGEPRLALLALDLDRFKQVNDSLGHDGGDELLRQVSARITSLLRPEDTLVRLGGDEFAVIQPSIASIAEPTALAQRIIGSLAAPFHIAGQVAEIGVSIGIATAPDIAQTETDLVSRADNALYNAKATGRNRLCIHGRNEGSPAELEQRLRNAFDQRGAA